VPCPDCGAPLAPGVLRCHACGLPLDSAAARELWEVDRRLEALRARRAELLVAARAERTAAPVPVPVPAPHAEATSPFAPPPAPVAPRWGAQQLLLGAGVLLVAVAAVVFVAVVWSSLGVAGQTAVLLVLTGASAAASRLAAGRSLRASAEALAVLAVALLVICLVAARELDLLGLEALDPDVYAAGAATAVALAAALADRLLALPGRGARSWAVAAVLAGALVPSLAVAAVDGSALAWATAAVATAAVATAATTAGLALAPAGRRAGTRVRVLLAVVGALHLAGALLVLAVLVLTGLDGGGTPWACLLLLATAALGAALVRRAGGRRAVAGLGEGVAWTGLLGAVLAASWEGGPPGLLGAAAVLAAAAAAAAAAAVLAGRPSAPRRTLPRRTVPVLHAGALAALLAERAPAWGSEPVPSGRVAAWLVLAAALAVTAVVRLSQRSLWAGAAAVAVVVAAGEQGPAALLVAGVVLAAVAALMARAGGPPAPRAAQTLAVVHAGAALALLAEAVRTADPSTDLGAEPPSWARAAAWLVLTAALAHTAAARPTGRVAWVPASAAALLGAALAVAVDAPDAGRVAVLTVVGAAVLALAAWRTGRAEEVGAAVVGAAALGLALAVGIASGRAPLQSLALGAGGLVVLAWAGRRGRGRLSAVAVLLLSAATWVLSADADLEAVEPYSLPLAALALGVGAVRARRAPGSPSWTTVGPGLSAALLPSAVAAVGDDGLLRPLLVLLAGVAAVVVGVLAGWQAPVVTGAVAAAVVALSQLAPYAVGLPRWLSLGAAGVLLLALGVRFEQRRRDLASAAGWVRALQ